MLASDPLLVRLRVERVMLVVPFTTRLSVVIDVFAPKKLILSVSPEFRTTLPSVRLIGALFCTAAVPLPMAFREIDQSELGPFASRSPVVPLPNVTLTLEPA